MGTAKPQRFAQLSELLASFPETRFLDAYFADLSGVVRGKRIPILHAEKIFHNGIAMPASSFLLAVTGDSLDPEGMGFSDGDPDQFARAIDGTLSVVPWSDTPTAQVMLSFSDVQGVPFYFEPRNVLKRVLEKFQDAGLTPVVAFELEFYLLDAKRQHNGMPKLAPAPGSGQPPTSTQVYGLNEVDEFAAFLEDVDLCCRAQQIPSQTITSEYAPGQFEINLSHSANALAAADDCVMFKRTVQNVARKHGFLATFMAKPFMARSGSGLHLHVSLKDAHGHNIFQPQLASPSPHDMSDTLRHAVGGILHSMCDSMAIFAPNINSYRRFQPDIYVPVNPSWGLENRSVAVRIPAGNLVDRRFEHRVAGADANPYLTLAAILAGLHHGVTQQLDPGEPAQVNAGTRVADDWPLRLRPAMRNLTSSKLMNDYLGADYLRVYASCKLRELEALEQQISAAEYDHYLLT